MAGRTAGRLLPRWSFKLFKVHDVGGKIFEAKSRKASKPMQNSTLLIASLLVLITDPLCYTFIDAGHCLWGFDCLLVSRWVIRIQSCISKPTGTWSGIRWVFAFRPLSNIGVPMCTTVRWRWYENSNRACQITLWSRRRSQRGIGVPGRFREKWKSITYGPSTLWDYWLFVKRLS